MAAADRAPVADDVRRELEGLTVPGGPHAVDGPRATFRTFGESALMRRQLDIAEWYLALQTDVATDGRAAVVTAGPPGAGKTTLLQDEGFLGGSYRNVDADIIKEELLWMALGDHSFDDLLSRMLADGRPVMPFELASLVHRESTAIAAAVTSTAMRRGENVVIQGTLAWDGQPEALVTQLSAAGYESLTILDVELSLIDAIERATERWWLGRVDPSDPMGGRFVATSSLEALFSPSGASYCEQNAKVMLALGEKTMAASLVTYRDGARTAYSHPAALDAQSGEPSL